MRLPRAASLLPVFAIGSVVVAVVLRVVHRGGYYPGWDVAGAANGLRLVSTLSLPQLIAYYRLHLADASLAWNVTSVLVALLPGYLASLWPWEFWPHVLTPLLFGVALLLLGRALEVPARDAWLLLLAIGASPTMLSYAVAGFAYISNTLPFAFALWVVLRWQRSPAATALLALVAIALSWQLQELGRTVFIVFLAAAPLLPGASRWTRVVWTLAGVAQLTLSLRYPTSNTGHYATMHVPLGDAVVHLLAVLRHFAELQPDLPVLLVAGFVGAAVAGRTRWFWLAVLSFQLGLLVTLASNTGVLQGISAVWPRRVLLLEFLCAAACVVGIRRAGMARPLLLGLLVAGNLWQLALTAQWASRPLDDGDWPGWSYALPYTHTPLGRKRPVRQGPFLDSRVSFIGVDWYRELRAELDAGYEIVAIYNFTSFDENATDPAGIIDRLYLHLGHERFVRSVHLFGNDRVRVNELPIQPMSGLSAFVASLDPSRVKGYWPHHRNDESDWPGSVKHRREVDVMLAVLGSKFDVRWGPSNRDSHGRSLHRFSLAPYEK